MRQNLPVTQREYEFPEDATLMSTTDPGGAETARHAGEVMASIVEQVRRVDAFLENVHRTAEQQATTVGQINAAIAQLDQATQQNAALVEQSSAAADAVQSAPWKWPSASRTTAPASIPARPTASSSPSSGCTPPRSSRASGSGWRRSIASCSAMAAASRRRASLAAVPASP